MSREIHIFYTIIFHTKSLSCNYTIAKGDKMEFKDLWSAAECIGDKWIKQYDIAEEKKSYETGEHWFLCADDNLENHYVLNELSDEAMLFALTSTLDIDLVFNKIDEKPSKEKATAIAWIAAAKAKAQVSE